MERPAAALAGLTPAPAAKLEPDAIGVAQDTVIGMASSAPAATMAVTMAGLAAAAAYGGGPVILLCGVPMLIIANSYRRLNLWNANCGASFEWVGRAINPYLGFVTGWLMIAGTLIGTLSPVVVIGPSVLAVFDATTTSTWPNIAIATGVALVMLIIAVIGIRMTARTQVTIGVVEYVILVGFAIWVWWWCSATRLAPSPSPSTGSPCTGSAAKAASRRASSSLCSCTPDGTAPCTSTRR